MNNNRDTKFQGFAKALDEEIQNAILGMSVDEWTPTRSAKLRKDIIARRAHDLVKHTIESIAAMDYGGGPVNISRIDGMFDAEDIPDLTAWHEEEQ